MVISYHHVESSNIDQIGYDADSQELRVKFNSGAEYKYSNVPGPVFADFLDADSVGKFFAGNIKGQYEYERV